MLVLYSAPDLLIVSDFIRPARPEDHARLSSLFSPEYDDSLKKKHPGAENESVSGALLLAAAMKSLGLPADRVVRGEYGKPRFFSGKPYFSISHDGNAVICAVSAENVGIDLMTVPVRFDARVRSRIAARFFSESEAKLVAESADDVNGLEFARLWTAREAVSKQAGGPLGNLLGCPLPNVGKYLHFDYHIAGERYMACCYR